VLPTDLPSQLESPAERRLADLLAAGRYLSIRLVYEHLPLFRTLLGIDGHA
jgi:hypothetical protein